jgi:alpha-galactosidase
MQIGTSTDFAADSIRLIGLDASANYQASVVTELSAFDFIQKAEPGWWPGITASGEALAKVGLQLPVLRPESGILIAVQRV